MSTTAERDLFLRFLRSRGHRVTGERLVLLDEIYRHHEHIDAEELLRGLQAAGRKISRATVYRNLDLLVECGLVTRQRLDRNRFLYEHVHPGQSHHHLVCTACGRVVEFVSPGIGALLAEICRAHGFDREGHQLQVSTRCLSCAPRASGSPP